jgi:hypothetical protein
MRIFEITGEQEIDDEPLILYHGTLRDNIDAITENGLTAQVGEFVKHFYDEEDDVDDLVFAADKNGLQKCVNGIAHLVWGKTGNRTFAFTLEAMRQYGALCVIEADVSAFSHRKDDMDDHHPYTVEPGDYYSRDDVMVDRIMVGDDLAQFLVQNGVFALSEDVESPISQSAVYRVYHGTDARFRSFVDHYLGSANGTAPINMKGFNFTNNKAVAASFGSQVITCDVTIERPYVVDAGGQSYYIFKDRLNLLLNQASRKKYDGIIILNYRDAGRYSDEYIKSNHYIPFSTDQIELVN